MADDLSLLFRLRGDASGVKTASAEARAAVNQLKQSFGPELTQTVSVANKAFSSTVDNLNVFVGQRVPLLGGAFVRVTENLKSLGRESKTQDAAINKIAGSITNLSQTTGKSVPQLTSFLTTFAKIEGQANRDAAAVKFFGAELLANNAKLIPSLEQTAAELGQVAVSSEAAAGGLASVAGIAGPVALVIAALAAEIVVVVSLTKEIFALAKASADYQGKLFDLSQQVGVSVETLSALESAARKTGGSIDGIVQSLGIFQKKLEESVEDSGSKAAQVFHRLGVETTDTEQAFRQTIAALARMPEGYRQTALALELFGRSGKAILAIAKESKGDIDVINEKLKTLGGVTVEQARIADEFNDTLVDLDTQLRGLGTKAVPVVTDVLKDLSKTLEDNRTLFNILQGIVAAFAITLKKEFEFAKAQLEPLLLTLQLTAGVVKKIREDLGFVSNQQPTPQAAPAGPQEDPFTKQLKDEVEARKKLQAVLNVDFAKRQQQAQDSIALAQRELEAGKRTRQELLNATIEGTRKQTQAQIDALQVQRDINLREAALAQDNVKKQTELSNANLAIDAQIATKRSEQTRNEADLRAKARLEEQKAELASEQSRLDTLTRLGEQRIAAIEDLIRRERVDREVGLAEIEKIEEAAIKARGQLLKRELELAGIGPDRQAVLDRIKAIEADRTALEKAQSQRRIQITRDEFESKRQILLSNLDSLLQVEQIRGAARIAVIQAQADLRVKTEEQAAREILAIRLRLLDSEIEATQAKEKAAAGIVDPKERRATQAQLANDLKVLNAQRAAIQEDGNRSIDEGRQKDLRNEQRYEDELRRIKEDTRDIERDAAEEVIRLMALHFARRKDIIHAQRDLDLQDEIDRHQRETESIKSQQREVDEQIRILEQHLKDVKTETAEEIKEHARLIESLERLKQKRAELDAQQDAEDKRHQTRKRRVTVEADLEIAKPDAALQDVFDDLGKSLTDVAGKFADLIGAGEEFGAMSGQLAQQIGGVLAGAFDQFAGALGQTVANWVLLGETGPAVMRKILAQALASLAAEATVQAIKELALGFATLFFDPGESAAHFTAAALWGSIAGVSAIAGRAVAGDLFKPKTTTEKDRTGNSPQPLETIIQGRNQRQAAQAIEVNIHHQVDVHVNDSEFGRAVTAHVVRKIGDGGEIREVLDRDGRAA